MPNVPVPAPLLPDAVFWSAGDVIKFTRMLINDMQGGVEGQDLSDGQPYTWWLLNLAYAKLANALEDTNVESVTYAEAIVGPLSAAPTAAYDPNTQVRLGYDGYWDGLNDTDSTYTLPGDLLEPLELWERPSGTSQVFVPMKQKFGGLQGRWGLGLVPGLARFGLWEYKQNALYFMGVGQANDIRIRYIPSLPVLQPNPDGSYPQIPLARAGEALAYGMAYMWATIRNAATASVFKAEYDKQLEIIGNKSAKRQNAGVTRMQGYGFARRRRRY